MEGIRNNISSGSTSASCSKTQEVPSRAAILLKATWSLSGRNIPAELQPLHDIPIEVETDKTWVQTLSNFGVTLNPDRYYVQKYLMTDNVRSKSEYDLRQPIKLFFQDVKYLEHHREQFTKVLVVDRKMVKSNNNRNATTKNSSRQPKRRVNLKQGLKIARIIQHSGQAVEKSPIRSFVKTASSTTHYQPQRPVVATATVATPLLQRTVSGNAVLPQKQQRKAAYSQDSVGSENGRGSKVDADDDDDKSVVQMHGIPLHNIRQQVYTAAEKLTNRDLIAVRDELLELREGAKMSQSGRDHWMEWNMTCPFPAAILRTLFDV